MRTSRGAAVGVVTELVNVESTLSVGVVARDVPGDGGGSALGGLVERDGTGDLGVTPENSDCQESEISDQFKIRVLCNQRLIWNPSGRA